jgi:hypothetical protein
VALTPNHGSITPADLLGKLDAGRNAPFPSGPHWLKIKNPASVAVKRIAEIEWH